MRVAAVLDIALRCRGCRGRVGSDAARRRGGTHVARIGWLVALLLLSMARAAVAEEALILQRVPQLAETARRAGRGELGCGVGMLKLLTSRGEVVVRSDADPMQVFGATIETADLIALLNARAESNRSGVPGPMSGDVSSLAYVCLSTLGHSRDPAAVAAVAPLLTDRDEVIRGWAAIALLQLAASDAALRRAIEPIRFPAAALAGAVSRGEVVPAWLVVDGPTSAAQEERR
jgi:HEAT repeat protein